MLDHFPSRAKIKIKMLKFAVGLSLAILCSSCASFLHDPKDVSPVENDDSIIFGKDEVMLNDKPLDFKGRELFVKKLIINHVSPFVSEDEINRNPWLPGKYAYKVNDDQAGYFAFALPPGKYYYVELDYLYVLPDEPSIGIRTYMKLGGIVARDRRYPWLITFDVPSGSAVYIGNMEHDFHQMTTNWLTGNKYNIVYSITNDFSAAKKWYVDTYGQKGKNVVESIAEINNITNK